MCVKNWFLDTHNWVFDKIDENHMMVVGPFDPHPKAGERWVCSRCGEVDYIHPHTPVDF